MKNGVIHIYAGEEKSGRQAAQSIGNVAQSATYMALGRAVSEAAQGKYVIVVRFYEDPLGALGHYMKRLEPELKVFTFQSNIKNGMNFARKVLAIEECDLLVLNGIFDLLDEGLITEADIKYILEAQGETDIVLTGRKSQLEIVPFLSVDSPRFECYDISINYIK